MKAPKNNKAYLAMFIAMSKTLKDYGHSVPELLTQEAKRNSKLLLNSLNTFEKTFSNPKNQEDENFLKYVNDFSETIEEMLYELTDKLDNK